MTEMSSRERVLRAMRRETPDRPPMEFRFTPTLQKLYKEKVGDVPLRDYFQLDVWGVGPLAPPTLPDYSRWYQGRKLKEGTTINRWGVAQEPGSLYHFTHYVSPMAGRPASELKDFELYNRIHPSCFEGLADRAEEGRARGYAVSATVGHTYETAWEIRGLDEFLSDMMLDPDPLEEFVERIAAQNIVLARELTAAGVDIIRYGDDVANQNALMFSPDSWRRFFKDRLRCQIQAAKEVNPDVLTWYHSDGNIQAIIPELIEVGVDILNPLQPECMDLKKIKELYGDRLSFWGCIGTQSVMPFGNPDDVRRTVREVADTMGPGVLIAPTHVLEPEVPWENVLALAEAVRSSRY